MYAVIIGLPMSLNRSVTVSIGRQIHHIIVISVGYISQMVETELVAICLVQAQHAVDTHQPLVGMFIGFIECPFVNLISRIGLQIIATGECNNGEKCCSQIYYNLFHVFN